MEKRKKGRSRSRKKRGGAGQSRCSERENRRPRIDGKKKKKARPEKKCAPAEKKKKTGPPSLQRKETASDRPHNFSSEKKRKGKKKRSSCAKEWEKQDRVLARKGERVSFLSERSDRSLCGQSENPSPRALSLENQKEERTRFGPFTGSLEAPPFFFSSKRWGRKDPSRKMAPFLKIRVGWGEGKEKEGMPGP